MHKTSKKNIENTEFHVSQYGIIFIIFKILVDEIYSKQISICFNIFLMPQQRHQFRPYGGEIGGGLHAPKKAYPPPLVGDSIV